MGRRKARRMQPKNKRAREERRFNCLVCNQEQVVKCSVDHSANRGTAHCSLCDATYHCETNRLSQPIDVYSSWVDSEQ
jgi:transcription elongation factor Elf1